MEREERRGGGPHILMDLPAYYSLFGLGMMMMMMMQKPPSLQPNLIFFFFFEICSTSCFTLGTRVNDAIMYEYGTRQPQMDGRWQTLLRLMLNQIFFDRAGRAVFFSFFVTAFSDLSDYCEWEYLTFHFFFIRVRGFFFSFFLISSVIAWGSDF